MPKLTASQIKLLLIKCAHLLAAVAVLFFLVIYFDSEDNSPPVADPSSDYILPPRPVDTHQGSFMKNDSLENITSSGKVILNEEMLNDNPSEEITVAAETGSSTSLPYQDNITKLYEELYEETIPDDIIDENIILNNPDNSDISPAPLIHKLPLIAIVIDDMGINSQKTKEISSLKYPLTASFLSYASNLNSKIEYSLASGHEIMLHSPMEALGNVNCGPDALTTSMSLQEIKDNLKNMLEKVKPIKGINNHMGSKLTQDSERMTAVMEVLKERGLYFLDSKTSAQSIAGDIAEEIGIPHASRNVFLDNNNDKEYILGQLKLTEEIALRNGYAIAIGHPKSKTIEALQEWLPALTDKGFELVHLSEIINILNL